MSLLKAKNLNVITAVIIKMYILTWFTEIYAVLLRFKSKTQIESSFTHLKTIDMVRRVIAGFCKAALLKSVR